MYTVSMTKGFRKNAELCRKRGLNMSLLKETISILEQKGTLPISYRSHKLSGKFANCWECHIQPNWLLVWKQNDELLTLLFLRTGSHSDIF